MLQVSLEKKLPDFTLAINFAVENRILVLFGPSGSGKTTLLRCIAGLSRPDNGKISLGGVDYFDAARQLFLPPRERKLGYMFQNYALFPHLDVRQNIRYGIPQADEAIENLYASLLSTLGIAHLSKRSVTRLSGGEQQRVALARALVTRPKALLLDEPLSSLDWQTRRELQQELRKLQREWQIPFILVTHQRDEAETLGDEIIFIAKGKPLAPPLECGSSEARLFLTGQAAT